MATVIRVKRKRNAEPAEALLLACKRTKLNENFRGKSGMADIIQIEENVFHFAATVCTSTPMGEGITKKVQTAITTRKKLVQLYRPNLATTQKRVVVSKRPLDETKAEPPAKSKYNFVNLCKNKDRSPTEKKKRKNSESETSNLCSKLFRHRVNSCSDEEKKKTKKLSAILDIEENTARPEVNIKVPPTKDEDVLSNTVAMLKEKLTIDAEKQAEEDYVYDLYYCQSTSADWKVKDILYVQPCRDLFLHIDPSWKTQHKLYDDEDDSNDENNWRNDYPEEEDSMDEDEKRLLFDEEEDRYDSDDGEPCVRDDSADLMVDAYLGGGDPNQYDNGLDDNLDDLDYGDDLNTFDAAGMDSYGADQYDGYNDGDGDPDGGDYF
uniref:Probable RNA polymerase II nuclear localization protein SLC7A6OS n=1 Tax=Ciona savignyi TaxID=51511 RepID=H2YVS2_CIOSA